MHSQMLHVSVEKGSTSSEVEDSGSLYLCAAVLVVRVWSLFGVTDKAALESMISGQR